MSEFETIKITDIKPAPYNPRLINDENFHKLKQSLDRFGLVDPIVINLKNENTIIGGHQRYKVLLDNTEPTDLYLLRLGDIGWVFDNLDLKVEDENMEKLLNVSLNQQNLMGEWDNEKLEELFTELSLEDVDLTLTGFNDFEIEEIKLLNDFYDFTENDDDDFDLSEDDLSEDEDEPTVTETDEYEDLVKIGEIYVHKEDYNQQKINIEVTKESIKNIIKNNIEDITLL